MLTDKVARQYNSVKKIFLFSPNSGISPFWAGGKGQFRSPKLDHFGGINDRAHIGNLAENGISQPIFPSLSDAVLTFFWEKKQECDKFQAT